jgi:hypothetical protein
VIVCAAAVDVVVDERGFVGLFFPVVLSVYVL